MEKFRRRISKFILIFVSLLIVVPTASFAKTNKQPLNYIAFGDSLAHGLLAGGGFDRAYVEFITEDLTGFNYAVDTTNFGVSGYQTPDVLLQLEDEDVLEKVGQANLITLTIGANDVLAEISWLLEKADLIDFINDANVMKLKEKIDEAKDAFSSNVVSFKESNAQLQESLTEIVDELDSDTVDIEDLELMLEQLIAINKGLDEIGFKYLYEIDESIYYVMQLEIEELIDSVDDEELISFVEDFSIHLLEQQTSLDTLFKDDLDLVELEDLYEEAVVFNERFTETIPKIAGKIVLVGANIEKMLEIMNETNDSAEVFVMGYYNALPYLDESVTLPLIEMLNNTIKVKAEENGATFVPTFDKFVGKYDQYLDHQPDIHPNMEGYRALADAFMEHISKVFPPVSLDDNSEEKEKTDSSDNDKASEDEDETIKDEDEEKAKKDEEKIIRTEGGHKKAGEALPETATERYEILAIGFLLLVTGSSLYFYNRYRLFRNRA